MDYIDLREEIDRLLHVGIDHLMACYDLKQVRLIESYLDVWPEALGFKSRWGDLRFCSADANEQVDQLELDHQAMSNDHMPMEVWPFVAIGPHERLYSVPPCFIVADAPKMGFGEIPRPGWDEQMRLAGVNECVIRKVADYLERHQPVSYEADDGIKDGDLPDCQG